MQNWTNGISCDNKENCGAAHNNTVLLVCFIGEMLGQITKAML